MTPARPPRVLLWLARLLLSGRDAEYTVGDLVERWQERHASGASRADLLFCIDTLGAARAATRSAQVVELGEARASWFATLATDLRHIRRSLAASRGFVALAVATMAVGLGAVTAIFSIVYGVVLRPLPYPDADRLVVVGATFPNRPAGEPLRIASASIANFTEWQQRASSFEVLGGSWLGSESVELDGETVRVPVTKVTRGFFEALAAGPAAGRLFGSRDHQAGADRVAVVSTGFRQRHLAGGMGAIGQTLRIGGVPVRVIGVLRGSFVPPEALLLSETEIWMPLADDDPYGAFRSARVLDGIGRLAPGVTPEAAAAELAGLAAVQASAYPDENRAGQGFIGAAAKPLIDETVGDSAALLMLLLGSVGLLLLIVCANVANLFLARVIDREREFALRRALGGGGGRIVRLLVGESLTISLAGAALGFAGASAAVSWFARQRPIDLPRLGEISLSGDVFLFSAATAVATAALCAAVPAARAARTPPRATINSGGRGTAGRSTTWYRGLLIVAETALAVVLLVGAGLLFQSFVRVARVDLGIAPDQVQHVRVRLDTEVFDLASASYFDTALTALRALPGVESAGFIENAPPGRASWRPAIEFDGPIIGDPSTGANAHIISGRFFDTLGIGLREGRDFTESDRQGSEPVIMVNQAFARTFLGAGTPVGRRIRLGNPPGETFRTIVGVVEDIRQAGPRDPLTPTIYLPFRQVGWPVMSMLVRGRPGTPVTGIREALRGIDSSIAVPFVEPLQARIDATHVGERGLAALLGVFATLAAILAAVGIYGTTSHVVGRRRREIGIRVALGASPRRIVAGVVGQGGRLVGLGLSAGSAMAWWLLHTVGAPIEPMLFGITVGDPWTFGAVGGLLGLVGLLACYVPARRAARVAPVSVLADS